MSSSLPQDPRAALEALQPQQQFFIGIDSDGCVFDSMELKHKECFCPMFVWHLGLQAVSKYAREVWDYVNLYSDSRGANRFVALQKALNLLFDRPQVQARNVEKPDMSVFNSWCSSEKKLGEPALAAFCKTTDDALCHAALRWSQALNALVKDMVYGIEPFPGVRESLQKMQNMADVMVVSQTPVEALEREWNEHAIAPYVRLIAGQEYGTKTQHVAFGAKGKYPQQNMLLLGDAPGDYKAARENDILFFPIVPGSEEQSWQRFFSEALPRFFDHRYAGQYQQELIEQFQSSLSDTPPWQEK